MEFKRVHFIINPASGNNEPILNTINDVLRPQGIDWTVSVTHESGDGAKQAQAAIDEGYDLIAVYGGDGTILDVAGGMLNTSTPMLILPGGTANAMADELNLPVTLADALRLIGSEASTIRSIDVGKAGDEYFLLRVGTGMVATFSEVVTREMKDTYGIAAYLIGGIQAFREPVFTTYHLTIDGETIETEGTACLVTNGSAIGAMNIRLSPQIAIDDGLLDVYVVKNDVQSVLGIAASITQFDPENVTLQHWQGQKIHVEAEPPAGIFGDGENEAFTETPCDIEVLAGALKVLVNS